MEQFTPEREESPEEKKFNSYQEYFNLSHQDLQKPLLDVGAGNGEFIQYIRNTLGNKEAVSVEKESSKVDSVKKEGMIITDGTTLPFPDESFEIVIARNYLPMFVANEEKMNRALTELLRVTKQGGRVMGDIATPEKEFKKIELEEDEQDKKWQTRKYDGAVKLQQFLQNLEDEGYKIERKEKVIVITKF